MCRTPTSQLQCEVPVGHHTALKARARSFAKRFEKCRSRVVQELQCLQVSRSGRYSVERMLALTEYTRSTSRLRAVLVCAVTHCRC
ncbi:hypothetical protein GQ600_9887 [Phytophthora cactorum]|nr:hypothetical protein GQ600_9887 [Phytophthora cactorum]